MTKRYRLATDRHGTTAVEFALTAPLLFMLVMASVEFSRANMIKHTTSVAATEAARKSIVPGATAQDCRNTALQELSVVGVNSATVVITPTVIQPDTSQVTVDVAVPLNGANGFIIAGYVTGKTVRKEVTLQREAMVEDYKSEAAPSQPDPNGTGGVTGPGP